MLRRTAIATLIGAAAFGLAVPPASAADTKAPKEAAKLKEGLKKLYGKLDFTESIARGEVMSDLHGIAVKDKKDNALKYTQWWSEQVVEALYSGDKLVKSAAKTKEFVKAELEVYPHGAEKPAVRAPFVFRGPNNYAPKKSSPLLISIVDSKTDPKAWIEKAWLPNEDLAKEWIFVGVAESDAFDVSKDVVAVARLVRRMVETYNVDPNRIFLEGAGASCKAVQNTAMWALPDRLAGVILRNPSEPLVNKNLGAHTTAVVHGAEGAEKALAVLAKLKEVAGADRGVDVAAPDLAALDGNCAPLADWLRAAKPRETLRTYSWVAPFDKDGLCLNGYTGSLLVITPIKREQPTTFTVTFARDTNTVDVQSTNLGEFVVLMNDDLLDLDKEVAVVVNGTPVKKQTFERNAVAMLVHADDYSEWGRLFPAQCRVQVPTQIPVADDKGGAAPGGGEKK